MNTRWPVVMGDREPRTQGAFVAGGYGRDRGRRLAPDQRGRTARGSFRNGFLGWLRLALRGAPAPAGEEEDEQDQPDDPDGNPGPRQDEEEDDPDHDGCERDSDHGTCVPAVDGPKL